MVINSYFLIVPFVPYCTFAKGTKTSEYVLVYNNSRLCTHCTHLLKKIKKIFSFSLRKRYTILVILVYFTQECVLVANEFFIGYLKFLKKPIFRAH